LIALIYIIKAVEELNTGFHDGEYLDGALFSIILALGTLFTSYTLTRARSWTLFSKPIRGIIADYGAAFSILLFTLVPFIGRLKEPSITRLPAPDSFHPTIPRNWLVSFWILPGWAVAASIIPAMAMTLLFYFDHNVSSLLTQRSEFKLKKPSAYHWDFLILGFITLICGLLGIPPGNGLIPQAPLHTRSLAKIKQKSDGSDYIVSVLESRISGLTQSVLIGLTMLSPGLWILRQIPRAVLAGLFLFMVKMFFFFFFKKKNFFFFFEKTKVFFLEVYFFFFF